jgi:hypothetical protein
MKSSRQRGSLFIIVMIFLLILTTTKNDTDFDVVAESLLLQHSLRHLDDAQRHDQRQSRWTKRYTAYFADANSHDNNPAVLEDNYIPPEWGCSSVDTEALPAQDDVDITYDDELEEAKLEAFVGLLDEYDESELTYDVIQAKATAYFAKRALGKGKGKGSGKGKFSKGKGKGSSLSLEDRRKRLAALKERLTCKACGRKGHWSGDAACPKRQQTPHQSPPAHNSPSKDRTANLAVAFAEQPTEEYFIVDEELPGTGVALMAVRREAPPAYDISDDEGFIEFQGDKKFVFGQYKGMMFSEVATRYPEYGTWALTQTRPGK